MRTKISVARRRLQEKGLGAEETKYERVLIHECTMDRDFRGPKSLRIGQRGERAAPGKSLGAGNKV